MLRATTACTFSTSEPPKVVRIPSALNMFPSKCASRHNGVHFFDISTSKSGPNPWCFKHCDFQKCFTPQRRALFRHRNFQKSGPNLVCFVHFDLQLCFAPQWRALFGHRNFQKWSGPVFTSCATQRERTPCGSSGSGFHPSTHLDLTILSPRRFASSHVMSFLTLCSSILSISRPRARLTFSVGNSTPVRSS